MRFSRKLIVASFALVAMLWVLAQAESVVGRQNIKAPREQMERVIFSQTSDRYEYKEFQVTAAVDYDVASLQGMFLSSNTPVAHNVSIRSDSAFRVRHTNVSFSSSAAQAISVDPAEGESPYHSSGIETSNLWLTCAGTCNFKVEIW
jgi:hypothetical protein